MMSKKYFTIVTIVLICIISYLAWHFFFIKSIKNPELPVVSITHVQQKNVSVNLQTIGTVEAYSSVDIKSMVTGPLMRTGFQEGDLVQQNQILFEIDPRPFQTALDQAEAELERNTATMINNEMQLKRDQTLVQKSYLSKQDYDTMQATTKSARALVEGNKAAVENAKLQLEYATIRSPITGKTGNIQLKAGSVIKANDVSTLVTIRQINPIYVTFSIPQDKLNFILKKSKYPKVKASVNGNVIEEGQLTFIDNSVDTATGNIQMKATFANKDQQLWPGEYVTINFPAEEIQNALIIPALAMLTGQNGFYVFVVDSQSIAHMRSVVPGPVIGSDIVIRKGLNKNEAVITAGQLRVKDGKEVEVQS